MKFDVIVGNPPYNPPKSQNTGPSKSIWPDFVKKSLSLIKDGGYMCLVHPSAWRKPEHELWSMMTQKQIAYLRMYKKGEIFDDAVARVDWYVLQNKPCSANTSIKDQDEKEYKLNLSLVPFLSSGLIDEISKIVSLNKNETFEVICDYSYGVNIPNERWSDTENAKFPYRLIHSITSDGVRYKYSSVNNRGHFGIRKVIVNCGDVLYPINDHKGEFGMTQNSFGLVVTSKKEGDLIVAAINTQKFKEIVKATKWGTNAQVDYRFFKYLKKDFWKQFVDANGNVI